MGASRRTIIVSVLLFLVALLAPAVARAQAPRGAAVHVLEVDSEDADDQAEALTGALRSKVRASPGWVLLDTTQSLSMFTAALRCPARPDAACLQRIGDQLKTDRFFWGVMNKSLHQVTAEVHLWARGKPEVIVKETYSENLKDQNDDSLRKIATRIFERLTGTSSGTLVISAGNEAGVVSVDNEQRAMLDHGHASIQVPPGIHVIQVRGATFDVRQSINVIANTTAEVNIPVTTAPPAVVPDKPKEPEAPPKPFPTRTVAGWALTGGGVVMLAVASYFGARWLTFHTIENSNIAYEKISGPVCAGSNFNTQACKYYETNDGVARQDDGVFYALAGVGVAAITTGLIVLLTTHHNEDPPTPLARLRFTPYAGPLGSGASLRLTF